MTSSKFVISALSIALAAALFLPFDQFGSVFQSGGPAPIAIACIAGVLALSTVAISRGRLARAVALAIAIPFGAIAVSVWAFFVNPFRAGVIGDLFVDGRIGAYVLFFGALAGLGLAVVAAIKPERAPARRLGSL
jgi:hypothetical protein